MAVGGKKLRRSHDHSGSHSAMATVKVWATANRSVLGQRQIKDQINEISAIPEFLHLLELAGCIITLDAIGCQMEIVDTVPEQ